MGTVQENIRAWRERVGNASGKWGGCEICAVSKTVEAARVNEAWDAGIRVLGENRVQEMLAKLETLNPGFEMHLIGRLQTNKVRQAVGKAALIQSVDRVELMREIDRRAGLISKPQDVLIEVGIAGEAQKGGVPEEGLPEILRAAGEMDFVRVRGLMAVMPIAEDPEDVRPYFRAMRAWFDRLRDRELKNVTMETLSMGMSGDCLVAASEGATMVRLGRAIFGERAQTQK